MWVKDGGPWRRRVGYYLAPYGNLARTDDKMLPWCSSCQKSGREGGQWDWARGRKGCYDDCFNIIIVIFLKYFHVFSKFMSTIYQQLKDRTFQFSPACCSAGLFSVLACFFDRFVQWLPYAHVEGTQGRKVCLRKSPQKQQLVTLLWNIVLFYTITLRQNVTSCPHILCLSW